MDIGLEIVEWIDASGIDGWSDMDDAYNLETYRCWSVGHVLEVTSEHVKLAGSLACENGEPQLLGGLMCIPIGMIRSRRRLLIEEDGNHGPAPEGPTPPLWKGAECNASVGVN